MSEPKKCPKCATEMKLGRIGAYGGPTLLKKGDRIGDYIVAFYCEKCGYIELYNKKILDNLERVES